MSEDLEKKLLDILESEDDLDPSQFEEALEAVRAGFPDLDSKAQDAMARVIMCQMPSPEEIEKAERTAIHNAEVEASREAELQRRQDRRDASGKKRNK